MDLLGSKDNILKEQDCNLANNLMAIFDICAQIQKESYSNLSIRTFSDNICFLSPLKENEEENCSNFKNFLQIVAAFQSMLLLTTGELVRGGIVADDAYCDEKLIWGKALVRAYTSENKNPYPNIAIDKVSCGKYFDPHAKYLIADPDGEQPYLNYLSILTNEKAESVLLQYHKKLLEKIDKTFQNNSEFDAGTINKIIWTCKYYNQAMKVINRSDLLISSTLRIGDKEKSLIDMNEDVMHLPDLSAGSKERN